MKFLSKLFSSIFGKLAADPVDMETSIKALYPDALIMKDAFPASPVNLNFIVLPSVEDGLPENLKDIVKNGDGLTQVVFFGDTARAIVLAKTDTAGLAKMFTEKLLEHTTIDEKLADIVTHATELYNSLIPGGKLSPAQLTKNVLAFLAILLSKNKAFANAKELYATVVAEYLTGGKLAANLPKVITGEMKKLGLDKLSANPVAAFALNLFSVQINTAVEQAFKKLSGDIQVF